MGGLARAAALSRRRRREIARLGAEARWGPTRTARNVASLECWLRSPRMQRYFQAEMKRWDELPLRRSLRESDERYGPAMTLSAWAGARMVNGNRPTVARDPRVPVPRSGPRRGRATRRTRAELAAVRRSPGYGREGDLLGKT